VTSTDKTRIARDLYSRKGRFILELIQNVEDCEFNHTDGPPSISFEVSPLEVIVESNQDGFIQRDVKHICRTGRSWKRGQLGYVGDKGIGFKSVFMVASRVEIQSNAFSFSLTYNGGHTPEERLGMITPIIENHPISPSERPLTRMTLTLNGETQYSALSSDFEAIPNTLLLFLSKVKQIRFKFHPPDEERSFARTFRISTETGGIKCITLDVDEFGGSLRWRYLVRKTLLLGLPNVPARLGINKCEAVLAFPIDEQGFPSTRTGYDIYAFLPVCTVGFNVSCL
jgi:hypothetical protein